MKKDYFKLGLDIFIALIFALLYNTRVFGGLAFHEIIGLGIGAIFIVHILLNWQWVIKVTQRLFDRTLPSKTRVGYVINILLLISMSFTIVSGLMISKVLFPELGLVNQRAFHGFHIDVSYLTLVIVGVHVGLHGQWIMCLMKKGIQGESIKYGYRRGQNSISLDPIAGGDSITFKSIQHQNSTDRSEHQYVATSAD